MPPWRDRRVSRVADPTARTARDSTRGSDRDAVTRVSASLGKAIASYERLIMPGASRFDAYVEDGDKVRHGRKSGQDDIAVTLINDEAGSVKEPVDLLTMARTKLTSNAFLETAMGYPMNIGAAAHAASVTAKMIRNYEGLGLIPEATRTDAGYRQYTERDVTVLRFIRESRSMGFPIKQIEHLLGLWADASRQSREVKDLAREHIAELDRKMAEMAQMKASLEPITAGCRGVERADCPILSRLSGDAAAHPLNAPPPKVPNEASRKAERTEARQDRVPPALRPVDLDAGLAPGGRGRTRLAGRPYMDRRTALAIFKAVADRCSSLKGADALDLSKSVVSRPVQALEKALGVRLLQSTTRRVSLVPEGEECCS